MPWMLCGVSHADHTASLNWKTQLPRTLAFITNWPEDENLGLLSSSSEEKGDVLGRPHHVISYQKMNSDALTSLVVPDIL